MHWQDEDNGGRRHRLKRLLLTASRPSHEGGTPNASGVAFTNALIIEARSPQGGASCGAPLSEALSVSARNDQNDR